MPSHSQRIPRRCHSETLERSAPAASPLAVPIPPRLGDGHEAPGPTPPQRPSRWRGRGARLQGPGTFVAPRPSNPLEKGWVGFDGPQRGEAAEGARAPTGKGRGALSPHPRERHPLGTKGVEQRLSRNAKAMASGGWGEKVQGRAKRGLESRKRAWESLNSSYIAGYIVALLNRCPRRRCGVRTRGDS